MTIITHLIALAIGALAMDYLWARRTGVDKVVYARITKWAREVKARPFWRSWK